VEGEKGRLVRKDYGVRPGTRVRLEKFDPADTGGRDKDKAKAHTEKLLKRLGVLQNRLYAEGRRALLIVLQGMDTAGKDGVIRHVMSGVNPQSCRVVSFKAPTPEERAHDFLWRVHKEAPPKGYVGIFNRSHYEDVLITRVHDQVSKEEAGERFKEISRFEEMLLKNGTTILKFFLHISKNEQRERLQARLEHPEKNWKFSLNDLHERKYWDRYQKFYGEALSATSAPHAPWFLVPSNHKWFRNLVVAQTIVDTLEELNPRFPPPDPSLNLKKIKIR
jgi:PPK2 family polyphosphate:nucleotide phosphotransferase